MTSTPTPIARLAPRQALLAWSAFSPPQIAVRASCRPAARRAPRLSARRRAAAVARRGHSFLCVSAIGYAQLFEIGDQPRSSRFPSELLPRLSAGRGHIVCRKHAEPAKKGLSLFRAYGFDRQFQASTNGFGNIAHRDTLFRDCVIFCVRLSLFDCQSVETRYVEHIRRRPAIESVADIGAHALFAVHLDRWGDETLLDRVVNLGKAHDRGADALQR